MPKTHITSVVAHIDHGKTTLIDSLLLTQNAVSRQLAGELRCLDTRPDEQSRGITLKLSAVEINTDQRSLTIIDTPGHVDFESLVQASSFLADSFLILVDVCEGISPRLMAITNYINENAVLVLNKIDKIEPDSLCELVYQMIGRMNALVKKDLFSWDKNNVILAWSTMCYGMSYKSFQIITKFSSIKNATKFFMNLRDNIRLNKVGKVIEKFNIKGRGEKSVLMGISPLWEAVLGCIDDLKSTDKAKETALSALTMFTVLNNTKELDRSNLLFATRLFSGKIYKGDTVVSTNGDLDRTCIVKNIYRFGISGFVPVDVADSPSLVLIESDFLKHSRIMDRGVINHSNILSLKSKPFFKSRLILKDEDHDRFKEAIRTLSFLESSFKVKINIYGEYEVYTEGKVHFEKICYDLKDNGFEFSICEPEMRFCETVSKYHKEETGLFEISIAKKDYQNEINQQCKEKNVDLYRKTCEQKVCTLRNSILDCKSELDECCVYEKDTNVLLYIRNEYENIVKSVFEYFIKNGPLISDSVMFTRIEISVKKLPEDVPDLFSFLKTSLTNAYLKADPFIVPFYFSTKIQILAIHLGPLYNILHRYNFIPRDEVYDPETDFYVLNILIPHFVYYDFVDSVKTKTKGTAYLEFQEYGFYNIESDVFKGLLEGIRKNKGLFVDEKIVEDPEKQRTLKK